MFYSPHPSGKQLSSKALGYAGHRGSTGQRRSHSLASAASQFKSKNIRIYRVFFIPPNLPTEALFNVLPLFEMWNLSATIIIPLQRGHETFCLDQPSLDHFVLGVPVYGMGLPRPWPP